jgi:hypothetical protein
MTKELLDVTPDRIQWMEYDHENDRNIITTEFTNVDQILRWNKAVQGKDAGITPDDDAPGWHHVGRVPNLVIEMWINEGVNIFNPNHWGEILRRLDMQENRALRVNTGVIGKRRKMI